MNHNYDGSGDGLFDEAGNDFVNQPFAFGLTGDARFAEGGSVAPPSFQIFPNDKGAVAQQALPPPPPPPPPVAPEVKAAVDKVLNLWGTENSKGSHQRVLRDYSDLADSVPQNTAGASDQDRLQYALKILEAGQESYPFFSKKGNAAWNEATIPLTQVYKPAADISPQWIPQQSLTESGVPFASPLNYDQWASSGVAEQLGFKGPVYADASGANASGDWVSAQVPTPEFRAFVDQKRAEGYDFVAKRDNFHNYNNYYGFRLPSGEVVGQTKTGDDDDINSFLRDFLIPVATTIMAIPGYGGSVAQSIGSKILPAEAATALSGALNLTPEVITSAVGRGIINAGIQGALGGDVEDVLRAGALPLAAPVVSQGIGQAVGAVAPPDFDPVLGQAAQPITDAVQKAITAGALTGLSGGDALAGAQQTLLNSAAQAAGSEVGLPPKVSQGVLDLIQSEGPIDPTTAFKTAAGALEALAPKDKDLRAEIDQLTGETLASGAPIGEGEMFVSPSFSGPDASSQVAQYLQTQVNLGSSGITRSGGEYLVRDPDSGVVHRFDLNGRPLGTTPMLGASGATAEEVRDFLGAPHVQSLFGEGLLNPGAGAGALIGLGESATPAESGTSVPVFGEASGSFASPGVIPGLAGVATDAPAPVTDDAGFALALMPDGTVRPEQETYVPVEVMPPVAPPAPPVTPAQPGDYGRNVFDEIERALAQQEQERREQDLRLQEAEEQRAREAAAAAREAENQAAIEREQELQRQQAERQFQQQQAEAEEARRAEAERQQAAAAAAERQQQQELQFQQQQAAEEQARQAAAEAGQAAAAAAERRAQEQRAFQQQQAREEEERRAMEEAAQAGAAGAAGAPGGGSPGAASAGMPETTAGAGILSPDYREAPAGDLTPGIPGTTGGGAPGPAAGPTAGAEAPPSTGGAVAGTGAAAAGSGAGTGAVAGPGAGTTTGAGAGATTGAGSGLTPQEIQEALAGLGLATQDDVSRAVAGIQIPPGISREDVTTAIGDYMRQNPGLSAQDVAAQVSQQLNQLPTYATPADVQRAVQGALAGYATSADVAGLGQSTQQTITGVEGRLNARVGELMQQGVDYQAATNQALQELGGSIGGVRSELTGKLTDLSSEMQRQYAGLTAGQQAEVDARVRQGEDLTRAIGDVQAGLQTQISGVQSGLQTQIGGVQQGVSELDTRLTTRIDQLMQQGADYQTATNQALAEVTGGLATLSEQQATAEAARQAAEAARQEEARRQAQAQQQESQRQQMLSLGTSLQGKGASTAMDPYKATFLAPFIVGGEAPKGFTSPLAGFLKGALTQGFMPDTPKQRQAAPEEPAEFFDGSTMIAQNPLEMYNPEQEYQGLFGFRSGGLVPLMAQGGTRYGHNAHGALRVLEHSGKHRVDYRQGDAVTGIGDGQSDDIPAMLADGEFVIPADVVSALGNGSTKAGSDKLYDMMHSIRRHHRSAGPKDLPPPAKKSPLDYITKRRSSR